MAGAAERADRARPLIDALLPEYDVRERHHTFVRASPATTWAALHAADLAAAPVVRLLLGLRALPAAVARGPRGVRELLGRAPAAVTVASFEAQGFRTLVAAPPTDLVLGLEGRFWRPGGGLCTPAPADFRTRPPAPGTARAVWSFQLRAGRAGGTELSTETRVRCADAAVRRRFLPYWWLIRPASGLIRRLMLRAIRRAAESDAAAGR